MAIDLFHGRRLLFAGAGWSWFWLAVGAVALVLLAVLYREERRLVSRRTGVALLGLRLAAAAVLVLALFEPIATRSYREPVQGRVIVAVDVSASMATADPGRTPDEQRRLARTLQSPPGDAVGALTRRDVARRLLEGAGSPIRRLEAEHQVELFSFARETAPATRAGLSETLRRPDDSALTTDWQPVLTEALRDRDAPVRAVVLLTDGRRNGPGGRDEAAALERLAARGVPVYPILIGSTVPPRDAAVAAVRAPKGVYRGDVANVEAALKLDGYAGREVAVTLERPGAPPLERRLQIPADAPSARPVVNFAVPLSEAGSIPLTIAVQPLDGDVQPDNDRAVVTVQTSDDKAAVLLVDGEPRWELRYLRNALARDPRVKLETVVFHQPETTGVSTQPTYGVRLPSPPEPETAATETTAASESATADPLGAFDVIVLGDVDPADVTAATWARLESYVGERGGTLILSPGPRFWSTLTAQEIPRKLSPVRSPRPVAPAPEAASAAASSLPPGVGVQPAPAANADPAAWPMLQFGSGSNPEQNRLLWAGLPRLPRVLAGLPKPGATVLAAVPSPGGDEADSAAVIAAHAYGLGKVLWVGADTWRWRHRVGDAYHHRFWGQAVRWGASGKLATGNGFVRFGPVNPQVAEGDEVRIQATIAAGVGDSGRTGDRLSPNLLLAARLFRAESPPPETETAEAVAVVPLRPRAGQPRAFEGTVPALPLGRYRIRLDAPQLAAALHLDDPKTAPEAPLDVVPRATSERVELAVDREPAARLAAATGGRVFADYEADALPAQLRPRPRQTLRTVETPLWNHPAAFLLFLGVVTCEWVLRKRAGLP